MCALSCRLDKYCRSTVKRTADLAEDNASAKGRSPSVKVMEGTQVQPAYEIGLVASSWSRTEQT